MMQPLALVIYEKLLPGTQVVSRLHDLNYRVQTLNDADELVQTAQQTKPMVVIADFGANRPKVENSVKLLRKNPATQHLPVIAFVPDEVANKADQPRPEGVTMFASETAVLNHLPQLLEQALMVE